MTLNCELQAMEWEGGMTARADHQYELPPTRNSAGRGTSSGDYLTTNERKLWQAEVAALNKELTAVRQHMDWQARRINELELRLNTLGVK